MTNHVTIETKDNSQIELTMFDFQTGLEFARSFVGRKWDSQRKVWKVKMTHDEVLVQIQTELATLEIMEYVDEANKAYMGTVYANIGQKNAYYSIAAIYAKIQSAIHVGQRDYEICWEVVDQIIEPCIDHFYNHI